jgi:hypothetical protein
LSLGPPIAVVVVVVFEFRNLRRGKDGGRNGKRVVSEVEERKREEGGRIEGERMDLEDGVGGRSGGRIPMVDESARGEEGGERRGEEVFPFSAGLPPILLPPSFTPLSLLHFPSEPPCTLRPPPLSSLLSSSPHPAHPGPLPQNHSLRT